MVFNKVCKMCGQEFQHKSKNKRYCEFCAGVAKNFTKKVRKVKKRRRKKYDETKTIQRIVARAYDLSKLVSDFFYPENICAYDSEECGGNIECHHRDGNIFNNSPENLVKLCTNHHKLEHSKLERWNMVSILEECQKGDSVCTFIEKMGKGWSVC